MYGRDQCVGGRSNDCKGLVDLLSSGIDPLVPQSSQAKEVAICTCKQLFDLATGASRLPFIEARGRNQAAAEAQGLAKPRFLRHGPSASVDELGTQGRIFCPGWEQPPTEQVYPPIHEHYRRQLGRAHIGVGWQQLKLGGGGEPRGNIIGAQQLVTTAHVKAS